MYPSCLFCHLIEPPKHPLEGASDHEFRRILDSSRWSESAGMFYGNRASRMDGSYEPGDGYGGGISRASRFDWHTSRTSRNPTQGQQQRWRIWQRWRWSRQLRSFHLFSAFAPCGPADNAQAVGRGGYLLLSSPQFDGFPTARITHRGLTSWRCRLLSQ